MVMGIMGTPAFSAILKLPSWKGRKVSCVLFRVPSGKIQMEMPFFAFSMASRMVFSPALMSWRSRKRQCRSFIQMLSNGHFSISFLAM